MTFVQLGKGMTAHEVAIRLVMSLADSLAAPVHFVGPITFLAPAGQWPFRGVLNA
jgi:hypothetical protein